jgi:signal transduction histidine kinase/CheY-like chemotaxis protein
MSEQVQSTAANLLMLSAVFSITAILFISSRWDGSRLPGLFASLLALAFIFWLSNYLLRKYFLPGLVAWFFGFFAAILMGCWLIQKPEVVLVGSVMPLIAVITISGWAGVLAEGVVIAQVLFLLKAPFGQALPMDQAWFTVCLGAFSGVFAWIASRNLLMITEWSLQSYSKVRQDLEGIRTRQVELEQMQEDLGLANRELARLSQRMKVLEGIAEEARQAKTEFVANVSHELRTPLNMIIGYADLISKSPKVYGSQLPASLLTDIKAILKNAQHLSTLVNDVLDLSQVEVGRMALSRDWVSPQKTISEAFTVVKGLFESKNLYLEAEVIPDLQPIYYDETRIRQVIINLLSNAGRFTEDGGVTLTCQETARDVVFSVTDTGPGIDAKDQERIFEPFQQANTSIRRRYGGSGLGLTISKQFIEMHGGKMWMESQLGVGTTIYFSLPKGNAALPLAENPNASLMRAIVPDDQSGYRVRTRSFQAPLLPASDRYVIVDPEQTLQRLLNRYLPNARVENTKGVADAIEALNQSPAQALILNIPNFEDVPDMVSTLPYSTPTITCWLPGEHAAAQRLDALEYLIKPVSQEKLLTTVLGLGINIKTVLIVDDEEDELHLFARHLESDGHGYRILQVTNGKRALSMLRTRHPDLMLLDLMMPGMDGFQVMEEKRRDPAIRDIPVIIISARDPSGDPIISDTFMVTHSGGLSQRNLIACIHAVGEILAPGTIQGNREI